MTSPHTRGRSGTGGALWFCKLRLRLTLDGDDELGNDGLDLGPSVVQQVVDSLAGEELVGMSGLTQAVEEQRQVVVVVQLLHLHLRTRSIIHTSGITSCVFNPERQTKTKGGSVLCSRSFVGIYIRLLFADSPTAEIRQMEILMFSRKSVTAINPCVAFGSF